MRRRVLPTLTGTRSAMKSKDFFETKSNVFRPHNRLEDASCERAKAAISGFATEKWSQMAGCYEVRGDLFVDCAIRVAILFFLVG